MEHVEEREPLNIDLNTPPMLSNLSLQEIDVIPRAAEASVDHRFEYIKTLLSATPWHIEKNATQLAVQLSKVVDPVDLETFLSQATADRYGPSRIQRRATSLWRRQAQTQEFALQYIHVTVQIINDCSQTHWFVAQNASSPAQTITLTVEKSWTVERLCNLIDASLSLSGEQFLAAGVLTTESGELIPMTNILEKCLPRQATVCYCVASDVFTGAIDYDAFMVLQAAREYFIHYCATQKLCIEELLCWLDIEAWHDRANGQPRNAVAQFIFAVYLDVDAPLKVHLSDSVKKSLSEARFSGGTLMFDQIQLELDAIIRTVAFPKFLSSAYCTHAIEFLSLGAPFPKFSPQPIEQALIQLVEVEEEVLLLRPECTRDLILQTILERHIGRHATNQIVTEYYAQETRLLNQLKRRKEKKLAKFFGNSPEVEKEALQQHVDIQVSDEEESITVEEIDEQPLAVNQKKRADKLVAFFGDRPSAINSSQQQLLTTERQESSTSLVSDNSDINKNEVDDKSKKTLTKRSKKLATVLGENLPEKVIEKSIVEPAKKAAHSKIVDEDIESISDESIENLDQDENELSSKIHRKKRKDKLADFFGDVQNVALLKSASGLPLDAPTIDLSDSQDTAETSISSSRSEEALPAPATVNTLSAKDRAILAKKNKKLNELMGQALPESLMKEQRRSLSSHDLLFDDDEDNGETEVTGTKREKVKRADKLAGFFGDKVSKEALISQNLRDKSVDRQSAEILNDSSIVSNHSSPENLNQSIFTAEERSKVAKTSKKLAGLLGQTLPESVVVTAITSGLRRGNSQPLLRNEDHLETSDALKADAAVDKNERQIKKKKAAKLNEFFGDQLSRDVLTVQHLRSTANEGESNITIRGDEQENESSSEEVLQPAGTKNTMSAKDRAAVTKKSKKLVGVFGETLPESVVQNAIIATVKSSQSQNDLSQFENDEADNPVESEDNNENQAITVHATKKKRAVKLTGFFGDVVSHDQLQQNPSEKLENSETMTLSRSANVIDEKTRLTVVKRHKKLTEVLGQPLAPQDWARQANAITVASATETDSTVENESRASVAPTFNDDENTVRLRRLKKLQHCLGQVLSQPQLDAQRVAQLTRTQPTFDATKLQPAQRSTVQRRLEKLEHHFGTVPEASSAVILSKNAMDTVMRLTQLLAQNGNAGIMNLMAVLGSIVDTEDVGAHDEESAAKLLEEINQRQRRRFVKLQKILGQQRPDVLDSLFQQQVLQPLVDAIDAAQDLQLADRLQLKADILRMRHDVQRRVSQMSLAYSE